MGWSQLFAVSTLLIGVAAKDSKAMQYEKDTWPELARLATESPEAGVHFRDTVIYNREKDIGSVTGDWFAELTKTDPWFKNTVPDFKVLPREALPAGMDSATSFQSVCINTALYLPWLASQCLKNGVLIKRGILMHITDAVKLHHSGNKADLILNCTGLSSANLGGVEDKTVFPARGQIVLVRNEPGVMLDVSGTDDGEDEATYIMQRAAGGGTVLGGSFQKGVWESQPDPNLAMRIMKRSVDICPALTNGKGVEALSVVRHAVGLRPLRTDGIRLAKERIGGIWVVHSYGHAGYGYQTSYGSAQVAVKLVDEALALRARL
ncbi:MAG: hypothetical protein M1812_000734 [Candelaria pacifica]|nr:MAG: hypothetical protein M1812_000734 [Candelaria pacifica]